jgi:hypothetical protein
MTSFYNSNANATSRSVLGVTTNNANTTNIEAVKDFFRFQELYVNALNKMRIDIGDFGIGDFKSLDESLKENYDLYFKSLTNMELYRNSKIDIPVNLDKLVRDSTLFDKYIILMKSVLTGLEKGSQLQSVNDKLITDISKNLLGEGELIQEQIIQQFLIKRRTEVVPFAEVELYTQKLDLKLWYAKYLQQHGPPPDGIFDVVVLSDIVNDLIAEGVITWEDFVAEETYSL